MADQMLLLAVGLSVGLVLLLLLGLLVFCSRRRTNRQSRYQELISTASSVPAGSAPVILVSQGSWTLPSDIPFTIPPRFIPQSKRELKNDELEAAEGHEAQRTEIQKDILAHRGSLSVRGWYPVGSLITSLYSVSALNEVVAPPPGLSTRLLFSVEYRHSSEQLVVFLLRLGNLPPRFHSDATVVELRLLPDDRRPRQAKGRGTGPDPEFNDYFVFQVSAVCVQDSTLSMCVLSRQPDGKRHAVGRVLFPLKGELGLAGRVLWKDLELEDDVQCSELGDVQIALCYNSSQQRLSVGVVRARGLQLLTDGGVCVQVSLQLHARVMKTKRSCEVKEGPDPFFNYKITFKLKQQHLDEACLRFEIQQPIESHSGRPYQLGGLVLGPFMYARGPQLQHWMDMINPAQEPVQLWHGLGKTN